MDIEAFRQYLQETRSAYEKWGKYVAKTIEARLNDAGLSEHFIKIPVKPRVKAIDSAIGKLGRKGYKDPLNEMTDLVGVRFVVLLSDDIDVVCREIDNENVWHAKVSKDVTEEIEKNTKAFDYQSQHFEVRPRQPLEIEGTTITADMCCEVQVRTLLQHAYAEMVHDNIYKPTGPVPAKAERHVARSMALMETTDDLFCRTMTLLKEAKAPRVELLKGLTAIYRDKVGDQLLGADDKSFQVLADEFNDVISDGISAQVCELLDRKRFIARQIKNRAPSIPIFNQAAVLFVYWLAVNIDPDQLVSRWPLPGYWGPFNTILSDVDRRPSY